MCAGYRVILAGAVFVICQNGGASQEVSFEKDKGALRVLIEGKPFATYAYQDETITRPYFCRVFAPGGIQVTRNHPPIAGKDLTDHDTFHPGLWLAFGDLSGSDNWRNRARVRMDKFLHEPKGAKGRGNFTALHHYLGKDGKDILARETFACRILPRPQGVLLLWDSTFEAADKELVFGDQEEMGLGVRLATPLSVRKGGQILNSDGAKNEKEAWGKTAKWCEYSGDVEGKRAGVTLMPDAANFRPSWFHARDYGLLVANPFGRNAFTRGEKSRVVVPRGDRLRLRFGVWVFAADGKQGPSEEAYREFLRELAD